MYCAHTKRHAFAGYARRFGVRTCLWDYKVQCSRAAADAKRLEGINEHILRRTLYDEELWTGNPIKTRKPPSVFAYSESLVAVLACPAGMLASRNTSVRVSSRIPALPAG